MRNDSIHDILLGSNERFMTEATLLTTFGKFDSNKIKMSMK